MIRKNINSSSIFSLGYDSENKMLEIQFDSGEIYRHLNVPERVYEKMLDSEFVGYYINYNIRNNYPCVKVR
ncbi:KTSC domain-containing protein [Tepidibacter aestuarii]|uniref:KTSC domain-containing protein n=1 Tax=Tepidibacter aestuarii TaxID=2925782 RepID=UPI0020BF7F2F|nr:KTSC domain-containing protein [Tepidibacter aestuarii]CAH2213420.1 KTSC domain-containing protein [Tepidibacter aestuarii]